VKEEKLLVRETFIEKPEVRGPLQSFFSSYLAVSTSNLVYQAWKFAKIAISFFSSFYYAFMIGTRTELTQGQGLEVFF